MDDLKRVANLYRVSTMMQVDDDDIPMQKNACYDFIKTKPFWKFEAEYIEKGVSGFHKSAEQRDVLQQIKADVVAKKFDVLLVFMFDRLGRREDETPFVVEWLVENGIEVWSVKEGQQTIDNRTDKLINYIRFWQSGGESRKTAMRVYESHKQMVENGEFRGGPPPFGYRMEETPQVNKHGHKIKKLVIHEENSKIVRKIFELSCNDYGREKILRHLVENNYINIENWDVYKISRILSNPVYIGRYSMNTKSKNIEEHVYSKEKIAELSIIDEDTWETSTKKREERKSKLHSRFKPENFLFKGYIRCGCCDKALMCKTGKTHNKYNYYYMCKSYDFKYKTENGNKGDHLINFNVEKYNAIILEKINEYLSTLKDKTFIGSYKKSKDKTIANISKRLQDKQKQINIKNKEKNNFTDEIINSLIGKSKFSSTQLAKLTDNKETEIRNIRQELNEIESELHVALAKFQEIESAIKLTPIWETEFDSADFELKRSLISKIINTVYLSKVCLSIKNVSEWPRKMLVAGTE